MSRVVLTGHARAMLGERSIDPTWVETTVLAPAWTEPDPANADALRAFRQIAERGGRVLRVVYVERGETKVVLTAFFDRGRRNDPRGRVS